jgi:hypothetical protein
VGDDPVRQPAVVEVHLRHGRWAVQRLLRRVVEPQLGDRDRPAGDDAIDPAPHAVREIAGELPGVELEAPRSTRSNIVKRTSGANTSSRLEISPRRSNSVMAALTSSARRAHAAVSTCDPAAVASSASASRSRAALRRLRTVPTGEQHGG